jgi:3-hydroxyacyl-CoA dehydrogenase
MLDMVAENLSEDKRNDPAERSRIAIAARQALLKARPAPLYTPGTVHLIETGNFEDDMARIAECDWIIEAVREDPEIKRGIFTEVGRHRRPGTVVSTNTSGVSLTALSEVMDEDMAQHFLGTHFFNPPRYLKLLEIIPGPQTRPEVVEAMAALGENVLGKGVVFAKDTPNFIANRILTFHFQYIMHAMKDAGLSVEEVDLITGPLVGHASSATFRTADLVGLDTYRHVVANVREGCPNDERREVLDEPPWLHEMIGRGLLGVKAGAGFYKKTRERDAQGKLLIFSIDVATLEYAAQQVRDFASVDAAKQARGLPERLRALLNGDDAAGRFAWNVFAHTAVYAGNRLGESADDIVSIDNAAKWGFGWEIGLFETWDALGVAETCARMQSDGLALPPVAQALLDAGLDSFYAEKDGRLHFFDLAARQYRPVPVGPNQIVLAHVKKAGGVVEETEGCSLIDLGDGILCAEFHTKMNVIDRAVLDTLKQGAARVNAGDFEGMIVANQGPHFCAGANLKVILDAIVNKDWQAIDDLIRAFQDSLMALRFCHGPVVAAPHHYTFGGGIEVCLHAARVVFTGETYGGLVEAGVGVIPAGGGTKEMLRRALAFAPAGVAGAEAFPFVQRAFDTISLAKVSGSGLDLVEFGLFTDCDRLEVNADHLVRRAKDVCRSLILEGYRAPRPTMLRALGEPARAVLDSQVYQYRLAGYASEHDALIAGKLAWVLTGGDRVPGTQLTEQDVLDLEREAFVGLCRTEKTRERIEHMLATGKPLRN